MKGEGVKDLESIREELRQSIVSRFSMDRELSDDEVREIIDVTIVEKGRSLGLSLKEKQELSKDLFYMIKTSAF